MSSRANHSTSAVAAFSCVSQARRLRARTKSQIPSPAHTARTARATHTAGGTVSFSAAAPTSSATGDGDDETDGADDVTDGAGTAITVEVRAVGCCDAGSAGRVLDPVDAARAAMTDLEAAGYPHDDISLVMQQPGGPPEIGAGETKADQGMVAGVSAGAVLGGIAGLAALAIPGVGAILAAGPIAAALGALSGAALGGLVGSFTGLGVPTEQAKQYERAVRAGGVVVAVKVDDRADERRASDVMNGHDPRTVHSYTQAL